MHQHGLLIATLCIYCLETLNQTNKWHFQLFIWQIHQMHCNFISLTNKILESPSTNIWAIIIKHFLNVCPRILVAILCIISVFKKQWNDMIICVHLLFHIKWLEKNEYSWMKHYSNIKPSNKALVGNFFHLNMVQEWLYAQ